MRRALAAILFLFEPFLAATLLLRVGPTLLDRDLATALAFAVRIALALLSIAAAIGLQNSRPYAVPLTLIVLAASASFAIVQYVTRVLPTSLAPDVAAMLTIAVVVHHSLWAIYVVRGVRE